jgi:hypothetical protein
VRNFLGHRHVINLLGWPVATSSSKAKASRFLSARFHAYLVLRLAGRARVVLHAGPLLISAHFAAWLLGLHDANRTEQASEYQ